VETEGPFSPQKRPKFWLALKQFFKFHYGNIPVQINIFNPIYLKGKQACIRSDGGIPEFELQTKVEI
jgi:hypothetical protein